MGLSSVFMGFFIDWMRLSSVFFGFFSDFMDYEWNKWRFHGIFAGCTRTDQRGLMVIQWGHKVCSQQDVVVSEKGLVHPRLSHKSLSFLHI